jgi:hypothetical protein
MNQHVNGLNNYGVNIFEECVRMGEVNGAELKAAFWWIIIGRTIRLWWFIYWYMYIYRDSGINRVREKNDGNTIAESVKNYALQANSNREFNKKITEANIKAVGDTDGG